MLDNQEREPRPLRPVHGLVQEAALIAIAGSVEPLSVAEITEITGMAGAALNTALVGLRRDARSQGWVASTWTTGPLDRNRNYYSITDAAKEDLAVYLEKKAAAIAQALKILHSE